jgi:hypothetical protein
LGRFRFQAQPRTEAECINCHGTYARGTGNGRNPVRSDLVLHDRYAGQIGPFLKKGHPLHSGAPCSSLTGTQIAELAHFIHQRVYYTLRGSPISRWTTSSRAMHG